MNNRKPGSTLADEMDYKAMRNEKSPAALKRLQNELADLRNPAFYKGFTQAERDLRIAGRKKLIAAREKVADKEEVAEENARFFVGEDNS
jgi:hypothetical protein